MNIYLDTSLLVPIYVPEIYSEKILKVITEATHKIYISQLAETEFYSALAINMRTNKLTKKQVKQITEVFKEDMASSIFEKIKITDAVFKKAIDFITTYQTNLRTLDALHLASAAVLNANLLTADNDLADAATHFNIAVEPFDFRSSEPG